MRRIGVLWSGEHRFEGTVETLEMLRSKGAQLFLLLYQNISRPYRLLGKQVVFVTNNSTKSRADYKKKLESMGVPASVVSTIPDPVASHPPLPPSPA